MYDFRNLMQESMDGRILTFFDESVWQLTKFVCAKPWIGSETKGDPEFEPSEVHAVYEAEQLKGDRPGLFAIIKIRVEVPLNHEELDPPEERAKYATDGPFNSYTERECDSLEALTAAHCTVTPELYLTHSDYQDDSILRGKNGVTYWMPTGYIVYIVMQKLPAAPLNANDYWNKFSLEKRTRIRTSFQQGCFELWRLGYRSRDVKIENLMWDDETAKCYFIDLEAMAYDTRCLTLPDEPWLDSEFVVWGLARRSPKRSLIL